MQPLTLRRLAALTLSLAAGCGGGGATDAPASSNTPAPTPTPSPAPSPATALFRNGFEDPAPAFGFLGLYDRELGNGYGIDAAPGQGWAGTQAARITTRANRRQYNAGWYWHNGQAKPGGWRDGDTIYVRLRLRYDDHFRWDGEGSMQNKMVDFGLGGDGSSRVILHQEAPHPTTPCGLDDSHRPNFGALSVKVGITFTCTPPVPITYGQWLHVQFAVLSNHGGATDGHFKLWVNNNDAGSPSSHCSASRCPPPTAASTTGTAAAAIDAARPERVGLSRWCMDTPHMLLKVGDLARRTGLTVRALHHYDSIGLLRPSERSESGYRLYSRDDVARLHGIQTLRRMGLPLADVAQLLDGGAVTLPAILARQIETLDQEIAQAQALRERLGVMQIILAGGGQPEIDDWLASLSMMSTFEQYFSAGELKLVFERWKRCEAEWPPLLQAVRDAMERGVPPDSIELQPLARRWMDVSARWMNGDIALLKRWGSMLREQPSLPLPSGMDRALLEYIDQAIQLRLAVVAKYISADELQRLDKTLDPEWRALGERAGRLMAEGVPPDSAGARELAREWQALLDRMVGHDAALRARLLAAYENEPLLQAGMVFTPEVRRYVERAAALDPDAT